jgi:hypothetical protein
VGAVSRSHGGSLTAPTVHGQRNRADRLHLGSYRHPHCSERDSRSGVPCGYRMGHHVLNGRLSRHSFAVTAHRSPARFGSCLCRLLTSSVRHNQEWAAAALRADGASDFMASEVDPMEDRTHSSVQDMMTTKVVTVEPATPFKEIIAAVIGLVVGLGVAALAATCKALLAAFFGAHHRVLGPPATTPSNARVRSIVRAGIDDVPAFEGPRVAGPCSDDDWGLIVRPWGRGRAGPRRCGPTV